MHRFPFPPDKGDKIRAWHVLKALLKEHEVDVVTHIDDRADLALVSELAAKVHSLSASYLSLPHRIASALLGFVRGRAASLAWFDHGDARRVVADLVRSRRPDVIVAVSAQPLEYVLHLPEARGIPIVADLVDVDSEKWAAYARGISWKRLGPLGQWFMRTESNRVRDEERLIAERAASVIVTTLREAELFTSKVSNVPVLAIPNGVDRTDCDGRTPDEALLTFIGTMDYSANEDAAMWAASEILPAIRRDCPSARLRIVGRNPTKRVQELGMQTGVEVTGAVESIRPHLNASTLSLIPLRVARGVQNKVLEALAAAVPVVTTRAVCDSLGATPNVHVLVGDSAAELAAHSVRLIRDPALAKSLGIAGRELASKDYRWEDFDTSILAAVGGAR